ncbi:N-acetyltransferase, putative [Bodo saltans]|uniref:N-acetyltransferase, putative n=1 Tax=Bodo saltans TaxID=75058 RepID=A0A0S4IQ58_BODSA|nr:N-acetyltransferase, putative [Bodo saltans]|eukprot:CUE81310.1 N-acetyltransferase, putative [Bodo saltans]
MLNRDVALRGNRLLLIPYLEEHVPRYHQWMCDPELLEATCSEPLSLEEEYENQVSWLNSHDKLTFIILAPLGSILSEEARQATEQLVCHSDANVNPTATPTTTPTTTTSITSENTSSFSSRHQHHAASLDHIFVMIGDCNLFVPPNVEEDGVEIEVMIAEKRLRRHGFAREAIRMLMSYAVRSPLNYRHFVAKILADNEGSKRLFTSLGFEMFKEVKVFGQEHYQAFVTVDEEGESTGGGGTPNWEKDFLFRRATYAEETRDVQVLHDVPAGLLD